jgi:hypothetical protein
MADVIGLSDVSTPDTGKGSQLKTGGRRKHNMAEKCKKGFKKVGGKCVLIKKSTLKSQIKSIERGEYWDSGGKKNPELNTSDSTRVRKQKIKELKEYHKRIGGK